MHMKKYVVGALVGGFLLFMWQFLSFAAINLHEKSMQYTPQQDSVLQSLQKYLGDKNGGYFMPTVPSGTSGEEMEKVMKANVGKPWAIVHYHTSLKDNMVMNMTRGLTVNIVLVGLLIWVLSKMPRPNFSAVLLSSWAVGLISFINEPYTSFIWFESFDIWAYFTDAIVGYGLVGLWLGWWLPKQSK